jgi:hypothetical protein
LPLARNRPSIGATGVNGAWNSAKTGTAKFPSFGETAMGRPRDWRREQTVRSITFPIFDRV